MTLLLLPLLELPLLLILDDRRRRVGGCVGRGVGAGVGDRVGLMDGIVEGCCERLG